MVDMAPLLLLLLVGVSGGTDLDLQKRIFGGHTCESNEALHHVRLFSTNETGPVRRGYLCGGSLISTEWVLTAAHCWKSAPGWKMYAYLGTHPDLPTKIPPEEITTNEIYSPDHDIMLVKLKNPTSYPTVKLPKCLPCLKCLQKPRKKEEFLVSGFGCNAIDLTFKFLYNSLPQQLQCVNMTAVDCAPIRGNLLQDYPYVPDNNWLCAHSRGKDTCKGDSGGGAVYKGKIYGLVSGGHSSCAFEEPCYFVRVCPYIKWIRSFIRQ